MRPRAVAIDPGGQPLDLAHRQINLQWIGSARKGRRAPLVIGGALRRPCQPRDFSQRQRPRNEFAHRAAARQGFFQAHRARRRRRQAHARRSRPTLRRR